MNNEEIQELMSKLQEHGLKPEDIAKIKSLAEEKEQEKGKKKKKGLFGFLRKNK